MNEATNTNDMTSGEIQSEIARLVGLYQKKVREELEEMDKSFEERGYSNELPLELSRIISSNQSRWSGGNSVSNLCEQVTREQATEKLNNVLRRNAYKG